MSMSPVSDRLKPVFPTDVLGLGQSRPEARSSGRRPSESSVVETMLQRVHRQVASKSDPEFISTITGQTEHRTQAAVSTQVTTGVIRGAIALAIACPPLLILSQLGMSEVALYLAVGMFFLSGVWGLTREVLRAQQGVSLVKRSGNLIATGLTMVGCLFVMFLV